MTTPEIITELGPNDIFVFGSNLKGIHGAGAAFFAKQNFGAKQFVGEGLTGQSYAFPTLGNVNDYLGMRSDEALRKSVITFLVCIREHPELTFWLTKVGCGLAGYEEDYMIDLFSEIIGPNLIKPEGW